MTNRRSNLLLLLAGLGLAAFIGCEGYSALTGPSTSVTSAVVPRPTPSSSPAVSPTPRVSPAPSATPYSSCTDKIKNGNETDIDCGGDTCPPCGLSKLCKSGNDCASGFCSRLGRCVKSGSGCAGGCDDGDACTADSCTGGFCNHAPITCNDGSACTVDTCDPKSGCVFTPISCDDGDACTTDTCDPVKGCQHAPITCDDSSVCTTDTCDPKSGCVFTPIVCDDANPCTDNLCDPVTGCYFPNSANGTPCAGGACSSGACLPTACSNGKQDPGETDIDCGGPVCQKCGNAKLCNSGADCLSGNCSPLGRCN